MSVECVEQRPAVLGDFLFTDLHSWKPRQHFLVPTLLQETVRSSTFCNMTWNHVEASGHAFQVWSLLFGWSW